LESFLRLGSIGALALALGLALPAQAAAAGAVLKPSAQVQAEPAGDVTPRQGRSHRPAYRPGVPDRAALQAKKAAAGHGPFAPIPPGSGGGGAAAPDTVVFGGLNQPGLAATDNTPANNGTPPDSTGSIGPSHYLEFVNSKVGVYRRADLVQVGTRDLDAFIGKAGDDVFDPQIQWDQTGNRWLYVTADVNPAGTNFLAFGWSKTADPTDLVNGWCRFTINTGNALEDYPKLGHDNNHILFGANSFRGNTYLTAHIWSVAKPANGATSCTSPGVSVFGSSASPLLSTDGDVVFTPVPAGMSDSAASGYVVAADSPLVVGSPSQIMAWHVTGPPASPSLTQDGNMNVTGYTLPANVPQPGTSNVLDSSDARLTQAVAHTDPDVGAQAVWTQHSVAGPGGRSVLRWYELLPASDTVRQQGTIQDAAHFVFNGAISPAAIGSSAIANYNVGSATQLAQIRAQSRQSGMTLGTMSSEITLGTSAAADRDFSCTPPNGPPCRWGDYAGASPDPLNDHVVWGSNQLNGPFTSDPHWTTRNFALQDGASAGYPRPKGATPMLVSLVLAYSRCTSPNRDHGPPLASGSCNPPTRASSFLTVGTLDSNGQPANAAGKVRFDAKLGDSMTPTDEADLILAASATDVRRQGDLSDYPGELSASTVLRLTDRNNGGSGTDPATVVDLPYSFTVPCGTTTDTGIGSSCSVGTSADALVAGTVLEEKRSIWQLAQVQLFDGGPDGVASTQDNTLFEVEGLFVP
jgi:hypothetical protein